MENFLVKRVKVSDAEKIVLLKYCPERLKKHFIFQKIHENLQDAILDVIEPDGEGAVWMSVKEIIELIGVDATAEKVGRELTAIGFQSTVKRMPETIRGKIFKVPKKVYLCRRIS